MAESVLSPRKTAGQLLNTELTAARCMGGARGVAGFIYHREVHFVMWNMASLSPFSTVVNRPWVVHFQYDIDGPMKDKKKSLSV